MAERKTYTGPEGRLFIGVPVPDSMREALKSYTRQLEPDLPGRYVPPENYHVTLAFLGQTPLAAAKDIEECIRRGAADVQPFVCAFSQGGHFGRENNAHIWAGVDKAPLLEELAGAIRKELDILGFEYDTKPAKPHITLARKVDLTQGSSMPGLPAVSGTMDSIKLFHSTRERGLLRYIPIAGVTLR